MCDLRNKKSKEKKSKRKTQEGFVQVATRAWSIQGLKSCRGLGGWCGGVGRMTQTNKLFFHLENNFDRCITELKGKAELKRHKGKTNKNESLINFKKISYTRKVITDMTWLSGEQYLHRIM